jgi:hypothetical protein
VCSRNFKNEEAITRVGLQRHRKVVGQRKKERKKGRKEEKKEEKITNK